MLEAITKTGTDETIFCELTNHSIVLCDSEGFERSYFQCSAIFALIFMNWFWKFLDNKKFHK